MTSTSGPCPCSTATAGASSTRSRRWAEPTSCCARSTDPRSCGASTAKGHVHGRRTCRRQHHPHRRIRTRPGPTPGRGRMRIVVGGAPPPTAVIERVETELGWEFMQIYGLTETSPLMTLNRRRAEWDELTPAGRARQLGRAGPPAIGIKVRIRRRRRGPRPRQRRLPRLLEAARRHRRGRPRRMVPHR